MSIQENLALVTKFVEATAHIAEPESITVWPFRARARYFAASPEAVERIEVERLHDDLATVGLRKFAVLPSRIQRRVGQPLPPGAVFVGKGSKWANPLRAVLVDGRWECVGAGLSGPLPWPCNTKARADWWAVEMFRQHIAPTLDLEPLRGKDLACWCAPDVSCHADVLLLLANGVGA